MDDRTWAILWALVAAAAVGVLLDYASVEFRPGKEFWLFLAAVVGLLGLIRRNGKNGNGKNGNGK